MTLRTNFTHTNNHCIHMLRLSLGFLLVAVIAAVFGFGGIAGTSAWIAKILFVVFLILFALSFLFGRRSPV